MIGSRNADRQISPFLCENSDNYFLCANVRLNVHCSVVRCMHGKGHEGTVSRPPCMFMLACTIHDMLTSAANTKSFLDRTVKTFKKTFHLTGHLLNDFVYLHTSVTTLMELIGMSHTQLHARYRNVTPAAHHINR